MNDPDQHIAYCSACGCKMNVSLMEPYTNVVCPDCGEHTRVKCELGHYLLTSRYAAGGMSMVFEARDTTLERKVAIKILNEQYSRDVKRMEEFEREAKITATLSHPHVVRVFTVGKSFGCYFIAMEMVSGGNLEEKISKNGAVGEEEMLPIALEIIAGLRAAKSAGVIHRDVKPGNILFDGAGHVKIVDFGLALVTQGGLAKADEIWATPHYVPPEALDGKEEDFRSDIYALGATLYHALSGKTPLSADTKSTREVRRAKEHIPPLAKVAPWLNAATCRMVDKAMALRPEDRFASYVEMEEAWNVAFQVMRNGGTEEPIRSEERLQRRVKRNKGALVGGGLLIALIVGGIAVSVIKGRDGADSQIDSGEEISSVAGEVVLGGAGINDGYDPEIGARVSLIFSSSHDLLGRKKFIEAQTEFISLMHDPDIKEPLPSWARIESLVAVWLTGDSDAIEEALRELRLHWKMADDGESGQMLKLEKDLTSLGVIRESEVGEEPMAVIQLMAVGLKNWELGAYDEAVSLFKRAQKHSLSSGSPLMVYREIAQWYLHDYQILKEFAEEGGVKNVAQAESKLQKLKLGLRELKTRGRARFHIRVLQLRLHREIKQFRVQSAALKSPKKVIEKRKVDYRKVKPLFLEKFSEARFAEGAAMLRKADLKDDQKELKDVWLSLADASSSFLALLETCVPEQGVVQSVKVISVEGGLKEYTQIRAGKEGGLVLVGENGDEFVAWGKMDPESVISLFQLVFKPSLASSKGRMQTELAISYAWLSGLQDRAESAANKLSELSPEFRKRWSRAMHVLDMNQ